MNKVDPVNDLSVPEEALQHYSKEELVDWNPDFARWFENLKMAGYDPGTELLVKEGEEVKITGEVWNNEWFSEDPDSDVKVELWVEETTVDYTRTDDEGKFQLTYRAPHPSAPETYFVRVHVDKTYFPGTEAETSDKWIVTVEPEAPPNGNGNGNGGFYEKVETYVKNNPEIMALGAGGGLLLVMSMRG